MRDSDFTGQIHGDFFTWLGPAPDPEGVPGLQNHVITQYGRQCDIGAGH